MIGGPLESRGRGELVSVARGERRPACEVTVAACPPCGLTVFGTLPMKTSLRSSASTTSSNVWKTSGLVRSSSASVAEIAA